MSTPSKSARGKNANTTSLTQAQLADKKRLEALIREGAADFLRVGQALEAIAGRFSIETYLHVAEAIAQVHAEQLYKPSTWQAWCKEIVGKDRRTVERMLIAAEVGQEIGTGPIGPLLESHARILARVPAAARAAAYQATAATGPVTAARLDELSGKAFGVDPEQAKKIIAASKAEVEAKAARNRKPEPDNFAGAIGIARDIENRATKFIKVIAREGDVAEEVIADMLQLRGQIEPIIAKIEALRPVAKAA